MINLNITLTWADIWISFLLNLLSGILVSFLFLFILLKWFRPRFIISPFICENDEIINGEGCKKYSFKIVNISHFQAFDAKLELFLMKPTSHLGANSNLQQVLLSLRTSGVTHFSKYLKKHHEKDPFALYAMIVHSGDPIRELLNTQGNFIQFKLTVRHGLTGLADTFTQTFSDQDIIKCDHKFNFGKKLDTISKRRAI